METEEQKILKTLTIMYIEDDLMIRKSVTNTLELIFNTVVAFESAEEALNEYKITKPDIILSDINLPNMSGIEFSQEIRKNNFDIPIILLTADTNIKVLLEATKLKLVDFIVKPVSFDDLFATFKLAVKDILRTNTNILKFTNNTIYDVSTKLLYNSKNEEIHITSSENRLLQIFINNINKTISTAEIKDQLWDDPFDASDSALKSVLSKLRSKIGKISIKNVSGMGYYLVTDSSCK